MDADKLKKLRSINYSIVSCCATCEYSDFNITGWGTCKLHAYEHLKHSESKRQLSINIAGKCDDFQFDKALQDSFVQEHWGEFFREKV